MQRIEKHIINKNHKDFQKLLQLCNNSKLLYNYTLYVIRQAFTNHHDNIKQYKDLIQNQKFINEYDLSKRFCKLKQEDYKRLKIQSSQQTISQVYKNWKSWLSSLREYKENKQKYLGRPKMPKYIKQNYNIVIFTNQNSKIDEEGNIFLSRKWKLDRIKVQHKKYNQIRIIKIGDYIKLQIVYEKQIEDLKLDSANVLGIDIGINNLCSITSNNGISSIINGRLLKYINQYYNKQKSRLQAVYNYQKCKNNKLNKISKNRNFKIQDYLHKSSRKIIKLCKEKNIGKIYIGYNKNWKQQINIGKKNNQTFVNIPYEKLIFMLKYKGQEIGIQVNNIQQSYTSKCSFLDNQQICKHEVYLGKRIKRGLFKSNTNIFINADINASLNILKLGLKNNFSTDKNIFFPKIVNL